MPSCLSRIHIVGEALRRDEGVDDGLAGFGNFFERAEAVLDALVVVLVDYVFAVAVFHFADGDGLVVAVDEEVDLRAVFEVVIDVWIVDSGGSRTVCPRTGRVNHTIYAKTAYNLVDVVQA